MNSDGVIQWDYDGIAVCIAPLYQESVQLAGDGNGGAIIVWQDYRTGGYSEADIYAQKIDSNGFIQYPLAISEFIWDKYFD